MDLLLETPIHKADSLVGMPLEKLTKSRVLIVCERDGETKQLKAAFLQAGIASESANNVTAGCDAASSGRFGVVFSTPGSGGASWTRFIEVASQGELSFEIVLLARTFDLNEWVEAMQLGAFDVLDVLRDLSRAVEVARRALGAGYLKRYRYDTSGTVSERRPAHPNRAS